MLYADCHDSEEMLVLSTYQPLIGIEIFLSMFVKKKRNSIETVKTVKIDTGASRIGI